MHSATRGSPSRNSQVPMSTMMGITRKTSASGANTNTGMSSAIDAGTDDASFRHGTLDEVMSAG